MDDLDSLLAEADALLQELPTRTPAAAAPAAAAEPGRARRCQRLLLAAPPGELGCNSSLAPGRGCGALRCTACDWRVLAFDAAAWGARAEYLFFRNSHPHEARLRAALEPRPGARAYCCQCRWETAEGAREPPRSWVCGKH